MCDFELNSSNSRIQSCAVDVQTQGHEKDRAMRLKVVGAKSRRDYLVVNVLLYFRVLVYSPASNYQGFDRIVSINLEHSNCYTYSKD